MLIKTDKYGWTTLQSAVYSGNTEIALMVLQNSDKEARDKSNWRLQDLTTFYRHEALVKTFNPEGNIKEFAWLPIPRTKAIGIGFSTPPLSGSVIERKIEAPTTVATP